MASLIRSTISRRSISQFQTLVLGYGTGGSAVSERMARYHDTRNVTGLVDPQDYHYYQPLWTLVGGGAAPFEKSQKMITDIISKEIYWYQNMVVKFHPEDDKVELIDGTMLEYKNLVIALGLQLRFDMVTGLNEAIEAKAEGICSNYSPHTVEWTWRELQTLAQKAKSLGPNDKKLEAIFTQPNTPIKCAGAPQKILYLADDYLRKNNVRDRVNLTFSTGMPGIFGQPDYAVTMRQLIVDKNINIIYENNLDSIDYKNKLAGFKKGNMQYDFIHITPPQSALDVCKDSPLSNEAGWIDVDKHTLQSTKYNNVWSLGDCSSCPTSKTAAAIAAQNKVLYDNLVSFIEDPEADLPASYDGYASCPLVTSYSEGLLAEFDYDLKRKETFPWDQRKVNRFNYFLKAKIFPDVYWRRHVCGKWQGPGFWRNIFSTVKKE